MQLHPDTARQYGVDDIFDPAQNIEGGVRLLRDLRRNHGEIELVLAAYNAGGGAVEKYNGIPPYRETKDYVRKVLTWYQPPPTDSSPSRGEDQRARIYRVLMPDGRILLTNVPSRDVQEQVGSLSSRRGRTIAVDLAGQQ